MGGLRVFQVFGAKIVSEPREDDGTKYVAHLADCPRVRGYGVSAEAAAFNCVRIWDGAVSAGLEGVPEPEVIPSTGLRAGSEETGPEAPSPDLSPSPRPCSGQAEGGEETAVAVETAVNRRGSGAEKSPRSTGYVPRGCKPIQVTQSVYMMN